MPLVGVLPDRSTGAWVVSIAAEPTPVPVSEKIGVVDVTAAQSMVELAGAYDGTDSVTSTYVRPFSALMSMLDPFVGWTSCTVGPCTWKVSVTGVDESPPESVQAGMRIVAVPGVQPALADAPEKS